VNTSGWEAANERDGTKKYTANKLTIIRHETADIVFEMLFGKCFVVIFLFFFMLLDLRILFPQK
jgi:hypothetical protein